MELGVGSNLRFILSEIDQECGKQGFEDLEIRSDLLQMLKQINALEKYIVAKHFCKVSWNIGSLKVLSVLQELRILTASEFILSFTHNEDIQLILNDFFEDELQLLLNLFLSSYYDSSNAIKMTALLDESLQSLYKDVLENPSLSDLKYLKVLKDNLSENLLMKVTEKHIQIIMELHSSTLKDAFKHFSSWINEGVDDIKFTKVLYRQLIEGNEEECLNLLFKLSSAENFNEWKFYLILLQTIASKSPNQSGPHIRKYLKAKLRHLASVPSKGALLHLLLTTRAATAITLEVQKNIDAYADWYKQNIGDMKFVLKTEEFQNMVQLMEECVDYEMEEDYIEIHSLVTISPPVLCSKLVQGYKAKCKLRLSQLKSQSKLDDKNEHDKDNESILIEDSD